MIEKADVGGVGSASLVHRDLTTSTQLQTLLQVSHQMLIGFATANTVDDSELPMPPEARIAAENTYIKALARMDAILDDNNRWGTNFQAEVEQYFKEAHTTRQKVLKLEAQRLEQEIVSAQARAIAAAELTTPHFRLRPALMRSKDGKWLCALGDPTVPEASIVGIGDTPHEATVNFDAVFGLPMPANLAEWCRQREAALEEGGKTDKQLNEQFAQGLDGTGNQNFEVPPGKEDPSESDSGEAGPVHH